MITIKTNYDTDSKLVLVNEENKAVAIINVLKGSDITEQVRLAILEELNAVEVIFGKDIVIDILDYEKEISCKYTDENSEGEFFSHHFNVYKTAEY